MSAPLPSVSSPWSQAGTRVTLAHGAREARELLLGRAGAVAVVVDVLSFSTTVGVALDAGVVVVPHAWRDDRVAAVARAHGAVLAVGRLEARTAGPGAVSLSPASLRAALAERSVRRLVLPSPNGSATSAALAAAGATVVTAGLRQRAVVAAWLAARLRADPAASVVLVAAGERWRDDDSLRPALEDVLGAGALAAALFDSTAVREQDLSVEALAAALTAGALGARPGGLAAAVHDCASGRELVAAGFGDDVAVAAEVDAGTTVPVLGVLPGGGAGAPYAFGAG